MNRTTKIAGIAVLTALTLAGCGTSNSSDNSSNTASNSTTQTTSSGPVSLTETGSSLLYPLFNGQWIPAYQGQNSNVQISAASTGSGTGISQAIAGTVNIGASDAYLPDAQMMNNPGMLNIPLAISAQQIMYNLPGMKDQHLHLTGKVLSGIFQGNIKFWDDAQIKALNPSVNLPHQAIIPVRRSDGSGDTFLFTSFMKATDPSWTQQGTSVSWPAVGAEVSAKGNDGIVSTLASHPYSISYVGISWLDKAQAQGLGYAALQNEAGNYVLPTQANIESAVNQMVSKVPADERISLIYAPGANSYPIINFEYAIVNQKQPDANTAGALKNFLNWAIDPSGGNTSSFMTPVHFLALPSSIEALSQAQINKISN